SNHVPRIRTFKSYFSWHRSRSAFSGRCQGRAAFLMFRRVLFCAAMGAFPLVLLPVIHAQNQNDFLQKEKFFEYPVPLHSSIAPLRQDVYGKGYFGASRNGGRNHEGVDLFVPIRMPIYAAKSGRIVLSADGKGYGKYIEILHPDGLSSRYAHLSEICVQAGDWVSVGQ